MINAGYHFSLPPDARIEDYRIISVLGQGSFGITYLAEDVNLGARLAIKEYLPSDWAFRDSTQTVQPKSAGLRENFEQGQNAFLKEARLLARVAHPNIVKVRRFFRAHGTAYIAMDFIDGRNLGDMLNHDYSSGGFPAVALKSLLISLLEGLEALHAAGIIHRDIKPGNVVIQPNGNPILVDFGAARNYDRTAMQGMTVIVTPGYAPIEQYSGDGEQGPFTDIYALGALAYRSISGEPPDAPYKRLGLKTSAVGPASAAGTGKYPEALLKAIDWALEVQPHERPQTAAALLARLREASVAPAEDSEPTRLIGEPTLTVDALRWRQGTGIESSASAKLPVASADPLEPDRTFDQVGTPAPISRGAMGKRALVIALAAFALIAVVTGYAAIRHSPSGGSTNTASSDVRESFRADETSPKAQDALTAVEVKPDQEGSQAQPQEADGQAATKVEAERAAAAAARAEWDRKARETMRQLLGREAAAKAQTEKTAAPKKDGGAPRVADARCTRILETTQLMGTISQEDRNYLKDHCN